MSSSYQITKNLTSEEVKCPCCDAVVYDEHFVNLLQSLRDIINIPFIYKPGGFYRCGLYNASLSNASSTSKHTLGLACDITTHNFSSYDKWELVKFAILLGLSIGVYSAHIHIDKRDGKPSLFYGTY